jgi:hypothetical protein
MNTHLITSDVKIKKRYWEAPSVQEGRFYEPYMWNGCISTEDKYYKSIPVTYRSEDVISSKPSFEYLKISAKEDGYDAKHYYLCEFQMSDFALNGKVNIDMACDETGKHFYIDKSKMWYYSICKNPLSNEENTMFINRFQDGTFHLNTGFELLAELEEREYSGSVWAVVSDECN